jgi:hypothetical protein
MTWARSSRASGRRKRTAPAAIKTPFRGAWSRGQRCLIITDGFYEWKKLDAEAKLKQPVGERVVALDRAIETNARTAANQEFRSIGKPVRLEKRSA